ncbi:DsbA family oxidoreductase [Sphingobacterium sp. 1.A.4]|uniref:DsbA family oxidoreductase n=1 Tax=Sphingobacterium sp. 1.A.4 TaxID=2044603 RepID=UPI000C0BD0B5|nr:DsbA family oxidoreductase [Sphingobacterium sp. 1.A.4]
MLIEIWSDIMCPFCYIGKHQFDKALNALPFKEDIEVQYKSYQLNPEYTHVEGDSTYGFLSRSKGISMEQAKEMTNHVVQMGKQARVHINFDTNIPANTFKSHELIHFAASKGKAKEMKERLFEAHFTEGLNIEKLEVLVQLATEVGLLAEETKEALQTDRYATAVRQDLHEARQIGIRGVPFFLFDRKYAVSGAQGVEAFTEVLEKSYQEWKDNKPEITNN